jgi:hypothetical protein
MVSLQALKSLRQWDNPFNYFQAYIESGNDFRELQPMTSTGITHDDESKGQIFPKYGTMLCQTGLIEAIHALEKQLTLLMHMVQRFSCLDQGL